MDSWAVSGANVVPFPAEDVMSTTEKPSFISTQVRQGRYFFLDLASRPGRPLSVVCGGRELCDAAYKIDRDGFQYYAIELVVEGEGELSLSGGRFPLKPGSIFAYGPRIAHCIRSTGSRGLVKYFVDFQGPEAATLLTGGHRITASPCQLIRSRWVLDILDQMLDAGSLPKPVARVQCELLLRLLVMRLEVDAQPVGEAASPAFETYCRCRTHIEDHFRTIAGPAEVATACGISPAYLSRLFSRFAQEGPLRNLTRLKMDYAADLLTRRDLSVTAVAKEVGFADPYHFSRVFKRVHGLPPRDFARHIGNCWVNFVPRP
jgi:AraC-like DNA-binding protein